MFYEKIVVLKHFRISIGLRKKHTIVLKMYLKICPRNLYTFYRIFQQNIQRNKSDFLLSSQSYKDFENVLPKLISKVSNNKLFYSSVVDRIYKITEFSAHEQNLFRGSLAILTYETLEKRENITENSLHHIRTLAWGVEMINFYHKMLEDLDQSREMSYWCNYDPSLLRSFVYELLKIEFMDKPSYIDVVHMFDKAFLNTIIGQHLDQIRKKDYKNFTTETYNSIADQRTSFHTFQFPILLAIKLMKDVDESSYRKILSTCVELGRLYHMQTDFLDCYGEETDESGIPKHSCDIQQGRCSWLAVTALQRCTPAQRVVFTACYGSTQPAHIERVKLLYDQLQIPNIYKKEKEKICTNITKKPNSIFFDDKLIIQVMNAIKVRDSV